MIIKDNFNISVEKLGKHYDSMDGGEFEQFCAELLRKNDYINVEVTSGSGDFGVDILAEKDGVTYAIQCKRSSSTVGNAAVQEIFSGREYYKCHVGVVMTNNYFTQSARSTAERTGIVLWDGDNLSRMVSFLQAKSGSHVVDNKTNSDDDILSVITNLDAVHHLLIFGTVGSGKSNLLHCISKKLLQDNSIATDVSAELKSTAQSLVDTLYNFGVLSRIIDIHREYYFTRYELQQSAEVEEDKILYTESSTKILEFTKDLANVLNIPSIRTEAITHKNAVGIDIPNKIDSLRLLLIDTKGLEFNVYNSIYSLLVPVIADAKKAAMTLGWVVSQIKERYKIFAEHRVRNLKEFNDLVVWSKIQSDVTPMSRIVIMIDELQDLYASSKIEFETAISEITLSGSKAGIHIIAATQNIQIEKSLNNMFPSLAYLNVKQQHRVELRSPNGSTKDVKIPLVEWAEVIEMTDVLKAQPREYDQEVMKQIDNDTIGQHYFEKVGDTHHHAYVRNNANDEGDYQDDMLPQAIELVIEIGQASTSLLQRRLKLGYGRAERIIAQMERKGIVGPFEGSKPRKVLISKKRSPSLVLSRDDEFNKRAEVWARQGLCIFCGGKIGGILTMKCKSCGNKN